MALDLSGILHPVTPDQFFSTYYRQRFLRLSGMPGRFPDLLPWGGLNDALMRGRVAPPRLRVFMGGRAVASDTYLQPGGTALAVPAFLALLRSGATLVVNGIDEMHDAIGALSARLEQAFHVRINVNAYVAWGIKRGFVPHWDGHDVIVLQVHGRKHWKVYDRPEPWPVGLFNRDTAQPPDGPPAWDGILEAGDALYIPRGWWHVAEPCGTATLHLSVGIDSRTSLDLMQWMLGDALRRDEWMRRDLPDPSTDADGLAYARALAERLSAACEDPTLLRRFAIHTAARSGPRFSPGLPWSVTRELVPDDDAWTVHFTAPFAPLLPGAGTIDLGFDGRVKRIAASDEGILRALAEHAPLPLAALYAAVAPMAARADVRRVLQELAGEGLVYFTEPAGLPALT